jgi:hypothetical protein
MPPFSAFEPAKCPVPDYRVPPHKVQDQVGLHPFTPFSLSGASQTPMRARGRFILLTAGEVGGHTPK